MAIEDLITDPVLRPILLTSQATLSQTQSVLTWLAENHSDQPSQEAQLDLSRQQKFLNALLAKLRGQNRRAAYGARDTKQETAEARQEVDRLLLQLQNLYYEQRHLIGEISACEGYEYAVLFKIMRIVH
jgi:THO complex subunit 5